MFLQMAFIPALEARVFHAVGKDYKVVVNSGNASF